MLSNEFDQQTEYYKFLPVENRTRGIAKDYKNCYIMTAFACCRESYDSKNHTGIATDQLLTQ